MQQQQQLHVCPCCRCSLFRVHSSQPRVYPCAVRDRLRNSFNHLAALKAEHSFHRFWWRPLVLELFLSAETVNRGQCDVQKDASSSACVVNRCGRWSCSRHLQLTRPLMASWLRSLDVCSSQISDVTEPTAATFVTPLSILPQHLMFPRASRCRLFSPVLRSVSCFNPLPLSSSLSRTRSRALSIPILLSLTCLRRWLMAAVLSTQTEGSCVAEGRGSFFFFLLRCLPLLFHCCRSAGFSHLKVIWRWLFKGPNTRARRSFSCFSFFQPVKSFLFFSEFFLFLAVLSGDSA